MTKELLGTLLVSKPFLLDPYFKRSVILVSEHDYAGSIGFIVNKPTDLSINDALDNFPQFNQALYFGGPLNTDIIHFIHTFRLEGDKEVFKGLYWGGNLDELKFKIESKIIKPEDNSLKFIAGYTEWISESLEKEIIKKDWIITKGTKEFILSTEPEELWGEVLKSLKNNYSILAHFPEDPCLN